MGHPPAKEYEKLRYMHRNPVTRGLVKLPDDWRWSSFVHHQTGREGPVEIESMWTGDDGHKWASPLRFELPRGI
ncbi:MAG: hypothetical protein ABIP81_00355 [Terriglobales bacterium]